MNKKTLKIILVILFAISLIFTIYSPVLALSSDDIMNQGKEFIDIGAGQHKVNANSVADIIRPIANILLAVGSILLVVVAVIIGIKYLTSSPDQKGTLKSQLIGLAISAVVLYGAYGIWSIVYTVLKSILE